MGSALLSSARAAPRQERVAAGRQGRAAAGRLGVGSRELVCWSPNRSAAERVVSAASAPSQAAAAGVDDARLGSAETRPAAGLVGGRALRLAHLT